MELSLMLMEQILAMVLMAAAGFLAAKAGVLTGDQSRVLSKAVLYIALPCTLVNAFQTDYDPNILGAFLVTLAIAVLIHGIFWLVCWLLDRTGSQLTPAEKASVIYSNAGNLIIPIVLNTLGQEYVIYTCSYMAFQGFLVWTHGQKLMGGEGRLTLKKVVKSPCLCAILMGMALFFLHIRLPDVLGTAVSSMGSCVGPLSMVVVGVLLAETDLKAAFSSRGIYRVVFLRLIILPLLVVTLLWGVERVWGHNQILLVSLLCAIGPAAATLTQMAQLYKSAESRYTSSINVVTSVLCAATMPPMIVLFQMLTT